MQHKISLLFSLLCAVIIVLIFVGTLAHVTDPDPVAIDVPDHASILEPVDFGENTITRTCGFGARGKVTDPNGVPIENAEVTLILEPPVQWNATIAYPFVRKTNENGTFSILHRNHCEYEFPDSWLHISAQGFSFYSEHIRPGEQKEMKHIELQRNAL